MVIHDLHSVSVSFPPHKAYPPLIVDTDAVLTLTVAHKRLKPVFRWHSQIVQVLGIVQDHQLGLGTPLNISGKFLASLAVSNSPGFGVPVTLDHPDTLVRCTNSVKRYYFSVFSERSRDEHNKLCIAYGSAPPGRVEQVNEYNGLQFLLRPPRLSRSLSISRCAYCACFSVSMTTEY